jgi:tagatose 1,6-diphosphate aldolase
MRILSIGKIRGLQQCATGRGAISILALDHRGSLQRALQPGNPGEVPLVEMVAFKQQVIRAVAPAASAVLLDPEVGAAQCVASGALPGHTGLVVALEATGYSGDPVARESRILPGWSAAKAKRLGGNAVKLLVYYHPASPAAGAIEALVRQVHEDCLAQDLAFMLEPLSYALDPSQGRLCGDERRAVVVETARRLTALGGDVLKAEFPLDTSAQPDEHAWQAACSELTAASQVPWVLLSASVAFETYLRQVRVACEQGASGVAVGRAVWKEAPSLHGGARDRFLREVAAARMARITALCDALSTPWHAHYAPAEVGPDFYHRYPEA